MKRRYIYYFRPSVATHMQFSAAWAKALKNHGVTITLFSVFPLSQWWRQRVLLRQWMQKAPMKVWIAPGRRWCVLIAGLYFSLNLLRHEKVVVQLKKQSPALMNFLKRLFGRRLAYVLELEGDYETEAQYLESHPYKPGFYSGNIMHLKSEARRLEQRLEQADHVTVATARHREMLNARFPRLSLMSKTLVLPTAIDADTCYYSEPRRLRTRRRLGLAQRFVVCYIGNVYYSWQNLGRTLAVFNLIQRIAAGNAYMLMLIRRVDYAIAMDFIRRADLSMEDYMLTTVPQDELVDYLNASDVGMLLRSDHPMNDAGCPGKVGDYMSCGLPAMISKYVYPYSEYIRDINGGVVLEDISDDEEILRKCRILMDMNAADRQRIAKWTRNNISVQAISGTYSNMLTRV